MRWLLLAGFALPFLLPGCWDQPAIIKVTAPARFETRPSSLSGLSYVYLRIYDGTRSYDVLWGTEVDGKPNSRFPIELTPEEEYEFAIAQETPSDDDSVIELNFKLPHIVRIWKWPNVLDKPPLYDREVCEVHHCKMQRKRVRIVYGMRGTLYTGDELKTLFPHQQEFVAGGCIQDDRKTDLIYVCPQCKSVYAEWSKVHARRAYATE